MTLNASPQYSEGPLGEPRETLIIKRSDIISVHDYARANCEPRDYLLIRLPMKIGLRTGEICTLRIENIDFESRTFQVLDSKRKKLYPLPLDPVTLELIRALAGKRSEGYVFRQQRSWKYIRSENPLRTATVWIRARTIAKDAGVDDFNPRILRHFFAAEWHQSGKSLEVLRRILRHKSLAYTQFYLARLVYFEDVQSAYDEVMNGPLAEGKLKACSGPCSDCSIVNVCKYAGTVPEYALGCRFKPIVKMEVEHATIN
ncbi:MAG: site-specific integrase [Candidatus Bathyarchaeia archaeon]